MDIIKKQVGRPRISIETKNLVVTLYNEDKLSCAEIARSCGISKASVFRIIRERRQKLDNGEEES